jgi:hypothetical protein
MSKKSETKVFTVYASGLDNRCSDKKMKHIDGPLIKDAITKGIITQDDTRDCDVFQLIKDLNEKGVFKIL